MKKDSDTKAKAVCDFPRYWAGMGHATGPLWWCEELEHWAGSQRSSPLAPVSVTHSVILANCLGLSES